MALKVLGQVAPAATTATDLYTVPASRETVVSTVVACNRGTATTFRVAVRPAGAALADQHYIVYNGALAANDMFAATIGISLAATDVLTVYAASATVSFSAFGQESNA